MTTEIATNPPPGARPDLDRPDPDPAVEAVTDPPLLTGLGTAVSLVFGGVMMLGFGWAWAQLFYPPAELATAGAVVAAVVALAAFVTAVVEFARAARWRRRTTTP